MPRAPPYKMNGERVYHVTNGEKHELHVQHGAPFCKRCNVEIDPTSAILVSGPRVPPTIPEVVRAPIDSSALADFPEDPMDPLFPGRSVRYSDTKIGRAHV